MEPGGKFSFIVGDTPWGQSVDGNLLVLGWKRQKSRGEVSNH